MSMQRMDPFREMLTLRDAVSRLFEESVVRPGLLEGVSSGPRMGFAVDLEQGEEAYTVRASLPGFKPEEVNVTVTGDTLTIRAEREDQQEHEQRQYLVRERHAGAVVRAITLPEAVQADQAEARFEHGELILTLPKAPESRPRQIPINVGGQQAIPASQQQGRPQPEQVGEPEQMQQ